MHAHSPRRTLLACFGLVAAVFLVYGRVAGHAFVAYDTRPYITENPWVLRGLTLDGLRWALTAVHSANWHPLTWLSHMLDVELYGARPGLHALENVAWHAANACLLFLALARATGAAGRSFFVAALFALHPLHVESVAWVVERKDVLSTFFGFLCILAWIGWTRTGARRDYALACACLGLGLLAKPMLVTWPCVLLLLDLWPLDRARLGARRLFVEKLPLFLLAAGSAVATVVAQRAGGAVQSLSNLPLLPRLQNALLAYAGYLGKTFWPADLAFYYPHAGRVASGVEVAIAASLLLAVTAAAVLLIRRAPYVLAGWLFFLGTLVPVIGIVQVGGQAMADRYTYVPLLGVFFVVAWGAADLVGSRPALRSALAPLGAATLAVLGFQAFRQVGTWRDTRTLAEHALAATERNHVAHDILGIALVDEGRLAEAEAQFRAALAIQPGDVEAASNLGAVLQRQGKHAEAEAVLREAIARASNLGGVLQRQGRHAEAEIVLRKALALTGGRPVLHRRLAIVLQHQGRLPESLEEIDLALSRDAADPIAHHVRGQLLEGLGRPAEARLALERSLSIAPQYAAARMTLARLLLRQGDVDGAAREIELALEAEPANAEAHRGRARVLALRGRETGALAELEETLRLQPDWAIAMGDMAFLLATARDPSLRDPARAVDLAERASRATGDRATGVLDALGAAYASAGRFADAIAAAGKALGLAREAGESELAARIEKRIGAYRTGTVDRETPR